MARVLIVDDDIELCEMLSEYLGSEGFKVDTVHDGEEGVQKALVEHYDILMLDVMLPSVNGFDCLRRIRNKLHTPVLMLTARGEDIDRIVGLEMGADDYLSKPFNPRELIARLRAILRRVKQDNSNTPEADSLEVLSTGELEVFPASRRVVFLGKPMELTSTEYNILEVLIRNAGQVVTKEVLSEKALGRKLASYDRSIDMHVSKLRRKFNSESTGQSIIKTVRSIGYQLIVI